MLKHCNRFICTASLLLGLIISLPTWAEAVEFTLDEQHSYLLWHVKHLGFSTQSGKWYVKGYLSMDKDEPEKSKVEVSIDIAKMITGIPQLDEHLKGKLFFDVAHYPTASFASSKVTLGKNDSATVEGILNLHGVSKPVTLKVHLNKTGINPITDRMTLGFSATTEIKRSDFGMNTMVPQLSDEVSIEIEAEAYASGKTQDSGKANNATKKQ